MTLSSDASLDYVDPWQAIHKAVADDLREVYCSPPPVLAATAWHTNSDLIADLVRLGYLADVKTFDATFGLGNWWKKWRPTDLTTNDIDPSSAAEHHWDFRRIPQGFPIYQQIAYDPPYVCTGGRKTTTMPEFQARYGIGADSPRTPHDLQDLIQDGLLEMARILMPTGILVVKCQDYISSGKYWPGTHYTLEYGLSLGLELVDRLERIQANPRPQPKNRHNGQPTIQRHSRRNLSTAFVFRKRK